MLRADLEAYLAEYLHVREFEDDSANGLQVEGREGVSKVAVAVTACAEAFSRAAQAGADALIVHHGLLWKGRGPEPIRGILRERLGILLRADLSLFAFHLPLDAHADVGNNAVAARGIGLHDLEPFGEYHGRKIGWKGSFPEPVGRDAFVERLEAFYGHSAFVVPGGSGAVKTVGFVSGGAAWEARQALGERLDFYVTGEPAEAVVYLCREGGLNFAALGHYATERIGVRALADHLRDGHGLDTSFIELENLA